MICGHTDVMQDRREVLRTPREFGKAMFHEAVADDEAQRNGSPAGGGIPSSHEQHCELEYPGINIDALSDKVRKTRAHCRFGSSRSVVTPLEFRREDRYVTGLRSLERDSLHRFRNTFQVWQRTDNS